MITLFLGLGNIGGKYETTRHNIGFMVVDQISKELKLTPDKKNSIYHSAVGEYKDSKLIVAKPQTYMNLSGVAAQALLQDYELTPSQMLVIVDDFNLPFGALRFRRGGSEGGHNGLASIIEELGTEHFPRLRLGIGSIENKQTARDYVLDQFGPDEPVDKMIITASEAALFAFERNLDEAMAKFNNNPA